ncbi:class I tRNA ligase family protein [Mycoplasmopsis agalactiae]|uniref:class I tRNA ligase family protein n=1 Tax=Mycoplasmopsis agalactiae TaxID=2110 RepID=UPI00211C8291|nr:class I tRNA ligase family protein [Mycoplasmopsis agalactiae]UUM25569.1 class I tRNA ligase family protein [Mycoplasmopsis agalactiae]
MLKIYVCGPTVYNEPHIGNLRPIITFDFMLKAYRELNKEFKFVHNITDVDDKIINKAIQMDVKESEVASFYFKSYQRLLRMLNVNTISKIEKVTKNINVINKYVEKLYQTENAYKDTNGNVWFDVLKNKSNYGLVSNQNIDNMVFDENSLLKRFKGDFALWKSTAVGIKFRSSFGMGRPGWHTECSALIDKHFGNDGVDIHGGGMDLTFPHHENENIQHYALYQKQLAKEWIRCGQLNLDGEKMSKSVGNVILAEDFINKYGAAILKLIFFNAKVSASINITSELIDNMKAIENKYKKVLFKIFVNYKNEILNKENYSKSEFVTKALEAVSQLEFSDFNFMLNNEIKQFNKEPSLERAKDLFFLLSLFHKELTNISFYNRYLEIYDQWRYFIGIKDYKKADKLREKLIKNSLI